MSRGESRDAPERHHNPLPCTEIDELYAPSARQTIARLSGEWLRRHHLTVTEFLHSAAALQAFEGAGTTYQHAIQKMAVALAQKSKTPVVQIIRALDALTSSAMERVRADERRERFPTLDAEALVHFAERQTGERTAPYLVNGVLAKYLRDSATWDEKLGQIIRLRERAADAGDDARLLLEATEALAAELVGDQIVFAELLGPGKLFGERLSAAIQILKGQTHADEGCAAGLRLLARHFCSDEFSGARAVIADHVLAECRGSRRLKPVSMEDELRAFRALRDQFKSIRGRLLDDGDVTSALAERSRRFLTQEALGELLASAKSIDEKLDKLLTIEESIEGAANKRALTPFVASVLSGRDLDANFAPDLPVPQRLRRAAGLQKRLLGSGLQDTQREKLAELLDDICVRIEAAGRYLAGLKQRMTDPSQRIDAYLDLFNANAFTRGAMTQKARDAVLAAIAEPDFLSNYTAKKTGDRQTVLIELIDALNRIGIPRHESLQAMAAS